MEGTLLKEISYLTRLIEQHKQTAFQNSCENSNAVKLDSVYEVANLQRAAPTMQVPSAMNWQARNKYHYVKPEVRTVTKVHINPNFNLKTPTIHINPKIQKKPSVHVNPNMMKRVIAPRREEKKSEQEPQRKSEQESQRKATAVIPQQVEHSVYVNPKLMKELKSLSTSSTRSVPLKKKATSVGNDSIIRSKMKIVNNTVLTSSTLKRNLNSSFISLSRRKLVRVKRYSKGSPGVLTVNPGRVRKLSSSGNRKTKIVSKYKLVMDDVNKKGESSGVPKSLKNGNKIASNKYKIDRTLSQIQRSKRTGEGNVKRTIGSTTGLIRIGGILYKSSRNQLVRSNTNTTLSKRRRCIINIKGDRFLMATNGKKLHRLSLSNERSGNLNTSSTVSRVDIGGMTFVEKSPNVLVRSNVKNIISNKVKQKSIQILRNKMRKNNQPCLFFQKFGYCTNQDRGCCPKLHDKKQVALCKNFLQGKCLLDNCPMSHDVGPEKMPTCKYFLEGCCGRDACPYLHVKVSPNTPICLQFLRGYCAAANKCKLRHVRACPEFDRTRKCSKGKHCPYPHKTNFTPPKRLRKIAQGKDDTSKKVEEKTTVKTVVDSDTLLNTESRKRYYDEVGSAPDDVNSKKRDTLMRKIQIVKSMHDNECTHSSTSKEIVFEHKKNPVDQDQFCTETNVEHESERPKRLPIGSLPAYIPIN